MIRLDVRLTLPSGEKIKCGSIVVADPDHLNGRIEGQFRYTSEYLDHAEAFPLDPVHLPLSNSIFNANRPQAGVHGVFEDSLPDDWGRRLMVRRYRLGRNEQRVPELLRLLGDQGLGALSYVDEARPGGQRTGLNKCHLQELALLADRFEQDPAGVADDELSLLFQAGSSAGGARPKALITDENGAHIAKFASVKDQLDVVGLEAAVMELSRRAGIETAATRLVSLGRGKRCLLVKRFDINRAGGRNHLASMQTILKADGYYNIGYRDLAETVKHLSSQPGRDLNRLYRQMIFNVLVGNTDDHLKNFLMLHDDTGWRLSPAFDLVPNIAFNRDHVLRIGHGTGIPNNETLLAEGEFFGIKQRKKATEIINEISDAVSRWRAVFNMYDVPEKDARRIGADIDLRLRKTA